MAALVHLNLKDVDWSRVKPMVRIYHGVLGWCWFDEFVEADEYPLKYTYATDSASRGGELKPNACKLEAPGWFVSEDVLDQIPRHVHPPQLGQLARRHALASITGSVTAEVV